jgi:hypothetical protein
MKCILKNFKQAIRNNSADRLALSKEAIIDGLCTDIISTYGAKYIKD